MTGSSVPNVTYFKRFRMELDLLLPLPPVPSLHAGYTWVAWDDELLEVHAATKYQSFRNEIDSVVFPNLGSRDGCSRLMLDIRQRPGFRPESTWLVAHEGDYCATVQGVSDRAGCGAIQNLGVVAAYRGYGLGSALLLQALHGFRRTGLTRAMLEVTVQNAAAVRLYRRFGFRFRKTIYKVAEAPTYSLSAPDWSL